VTHHLEVLKPLHIPNKETLPKGIYKKLADDVAPRASTVAGGGPGSGHKFKPLRYEDSIKMQKTNCEGANGDWEAYPEKTEGQALGGRHVTEGLKPSRGYSAVIMDMNYLSRTAGRVCEELATFFGSEVCYANWYITPIGSCAYLPHTDSEENFIVQLSGAKKWKFYNTTSLYPVLDLCNYEDDCNEIDPPLAARDAETIGNGQLPSVTLHPGDLLYVPRGMVHDAEVDPAFKRYGQHSSHVTLAVQAGISWAKLLAGMVNDKAIEDKVFSRDIYSSACDAIASDVTLQVAADASIGEPKNPNCPKKLAAARLPWHGFMTYCIDLAARRHTDMRRMVRKGKADAKELAAGLQRALEVLREVMTSAEIEADSSPMLGKQHPMVHVLQYANFKGILGESFKDKMKLGLSKGAWLEKMRTGLKSKLDAAFEGALLGKLDKSNKKKLLERCVEVMKKDALKNKKERKKYDDNRRQELSTWLDLERNGEIYKGKKLIPDFFFK